MGKGCVAVLAALLLGCSVAHAAVPGKPAAGSAADAAAIQQVAREASALVDARVGNQRLVMLGEVHGTDETPAIAGELAARWTSGAGKSEVLLGLEAASADQARVDRYLASKGTAADRDDLLAGAHWTEPMHDGRDSIAMAALIERVRTLRAAGADVSIAMFDAPGEGERDARMAASLRAAIAAHPKARLLVLTGNVHAMTGEPMHMTLSDGTPFTPPTTMARHLADLHPVSIVVRALAGAAWTCHGRDDCGPHSLPDFGRTIAEPTLEPTDPGDSWDYVLLLPRFTASRPAVADGS